MVVNSGGDRLGADEPRWTSKLKVELYTQAQEVLYIFIHVASPLNHAHGREAIRRSQGVKNSTRLPTASPDTTVGQTCDLP